MKNRVEKGKIAIKKVGFQGLKVGYWAQKIMSWQPNQKGKMVQNAGSLLKNRQTGRREKRKWQSFTYFSTYIFARTERKLERHCKIKDNNLSF